MPSPIETKLVDQTFALGNTELGYIQTNYFESRDFLYPRKLRQIKQLILFNNLQRGDENIASSMLITLFNRIMSNLWDDKMQVKFVPSEELDQKKINILNLLAQNDYREMEKDKLDYDWTWDALAFGQGYCETLRFDKKRKLMKPEAINPLMFGYDPYPVDHREWRYYWKWVLKSKWQIQKLINSGFITGIDKPEDIAPGVDPELWDFKIRLDQARQANAVPNSSYRGDIYQILEFFGHDPATGEKCVYWIDSSFSKILMKEKLDLRDADDGDSEWPIIPKQVFRDPHSSVPISILDLIEDKHRAKSVLLNLAYIAAKDEANPIYQYNPDKVNDVSAFFSRQVGQHISVQDTMGGAVAPLTKPQALSQSLLSFISLLDQEGNGPVGTGITMQQVKKGKQTATEAAITQQLNDLAQSLQSKIIQFGEKEFWSHWYNRYKRYTQSGETKIATIVGVKGMDFQTIDLGDIRTKYPPGVIVYSAKEAEYKELVLRRDLMQMYPQFQETLGQDGMRNFNKHIFFPKFLSDPTLIDIMIPKSLDEIKAEEENDQLNQNLLPEAKLEEDHLTHIYTHRMAKKTTATWSHIFWHEGLQALKAKQEKEQSQQPPPNVEQEGGGGSPSKTVGGGSPSSEKKPKVKEKARSPLDASVPLQANIQPNVLKK